LPREGSAETRYGVRCKNVQMLTFAARGRYGACPRFQGGTADAPNHENRPKGSKQRGPTH